MLTYDMDSRGGLPRYEYLCRCIRADILSGRLPSGYRLPSKRSLAEHLAVSVITVENAYEQLRSEGYVMAKERDGYFVCRSEELPVVPETCASEQEPEEAAAEEWKFDFASNRTNACHFPFSVWSRLMREVLSFGGEELLRRSPFNGEKDLRQAIAEYLLRSRGIHVSPRNIVVGAGTEYLYGLLVQLLGRDRVYAVEDPSYRKIRQIYRSNDVSVAAVKMDGQGVRTDLLYASDATVLHISPSHHYPTGIVTGFTRRSELLAWAVRRDGYIIEDDYDSEFRMVGKPIQPMHTMDTAGRVIYINTFSKTLAPSMRIGYMVLPDGLMKEFSERMGFYSCTVPNFEQLTLAKFISGGYFERHLNRMRTVYRKKRDEVMQLFLSSGYPLEISEENAGLHFLVRLHTGLSDSQVRDKAAGQGVRLAFLSDFTEEQDSDTQHILVVNYSGL